MLRSCSLGNEHDREGKRPGYVNLGSVAGAANCLEVEMAGEPEAPRHVWVPELAKRIITRHLAGTACDQCGENGCTALTWARDRLKAYRMVGNRPDRYGPGGLPRTGDRPADGPRPDNG